MKRIQSLLLLGCGIGIGFLCGTLMTAAYSDQPPQIDYQRPVLQVGETVITRSQLAEKAIITSGKEMLTRELQTQALVTEAARRMQVTVTDEEIAREVTNMDTFARDAMASVKYQYIPRSVWENHARTVLLAQKMMGIASVSDAEARTFFMKNPSGFVQPATAKLICISTETRVKANQALKRLQAGEDPNDLAALYNVDSALRQSRGEMNWVTPGSLGPDASDKVFGARLKPGQWTDVLRYEYVDPVKYNLDPENPMTTVFAIFYVKDIRPAVTPKFEDVKTAIAYAARMAKYNEQVSKWLARLAAGIGQDWKVVKNPYDPNSPLQPAPLNPSYYDKEMVDTKTIK